MWVWGPAELARTMAGRIAARAKTLRATIVKWCVDVDGRIRGSEGVRRCQLKECRVDLVLEWYGT